MAEGRLEAVRAWSEIGSNFVEYLRSSETFRVACREAGVILRSLFTEIRPKETIARMRLTELESFLERCAEISQTAQYQFSRYADISTGELARLARQQIQRKELDKHLADEIVRHAHQRLDDIKATVKRFEDLKRESGMDDTVTETSDLLDRSEKEDVHMQLARGGVIFLTATAGALGLLLVLPTIGGVAASLLPVSISNVQLFLKLLCIGATSVPVPVAVEKRAESLRKHLQQVTDGYQNLHKNVMQLKTAVHTLLEKTRPTEGDINVSQNDLARYSDSDYQAVGLRDSTEQLLNGLKQLKGLVSQTASNSPWNGQTAFPWNRSGPTVVSVIVAVVSVLLSIMFFLLYSA